jgi:hypothetical protein
LAPVPSAQCLRVSKGKGGRRMITRRLLVGIMGSFRRGLACVSTSKLGQVAMIVSLPVTSEQSREKE